MAVEDKHVLLGFMIDQQHKRRFNAAMQLEGTTASVRLREAIAQYLDDLDAGVENPQIRLELKDRKSQ
ncbi:hypothetical protein A7J50_6040 (plasmid) [Pseudomonas antarctica]|uniref:Uncharacterized protein n=1 Tax=Pseudomonas antarctica TaxID=219572 RepID=A0A172ZAB3_9PSED|nr:hypothetical protein A7J50_6040 [Pseudomonas antarctica]